MSLTPNVVNIFFSAEKHNKLINAAMKIAYNQQPHKDQLCSKNQKYVITCVQLFHSFLRTVVYWSICFNNFIFEVKALQDNDWKL